MRCVTMTIHDFSMISQMIKEIKEKEPSHEISSLEELMDMLDEDKVIELKV